MDTQKSESNDPYNVLEKYKLPIGEQFVLPNVPREAIIIDEKFSKCLDKENDELRQKIKELEVYKKILEKMHPELVEAIEDAINL